MLDVLRTLAAAYPAWKPSEGTLKLYARALADLPEEALRSAAVQAVRTRKWPPSVAELRELARPYMPGAAEPPPWEDAWLEVRAAMRDVGYTGVPEWSHPAIGQAAKVLGGWREYCQTARSDQMTADRARFAAAYQRAVEHGEELAEREAVQAITGGAPPRDRAVGGPAAIGSILGSDAGPERVR